MTDADAFEAFVRRYQDMVFGTAVRLLESRAEAEDVAQTVFLRAFERFDELGRSPSVAGWLKTVTRNLCLNHLSRHRSRWRLFSEIEGTDRGSLDGVQRSFAAANTAPAALERADRDARLEEAMRRLPDHQRVPLVLFHFEDLSYEAIAAALHVTVSKVKTDIHRARAALKRILVDEPR
jgi:RNA polymerase sigma-70 factor (ECF subfamily)